MFRKKVEIHHSLIELRHPLPEEVEVGAEVIVAIDVTCPSGCDLTGSRVRLRSADESLASGILHVSDETGRATGELVFTAPRTPGEYRLTIVLEPCVADGRHHEEGRLPLTLVTRAHRTSLAAWGMPSPVVTGRPFEVKVGARCSTGCDLGGYRVVVADETGAVQTSAFLGETPQEGTDALYWTTIEVSAPEGEGPCSWSVRFDPGGDGLPHLASSCTFSAVVVPPPEHTVTVMVIDGGARNPLEGARVLLDIHRGAADGSGLARIAVPAGTYKLIVRKPGYQPLSRSVAVAGDLMLKVELEPQPVPDEFADWM